MCEWEAIKQEGQCLRLRTQVTKVMSVDISYEHRICRKRESAKEQHNFVAMRGMVMKN